jgi:hypothetical protein
MARCVYCGMEIAPYNGGTPTCLQCSAGKEGNKEKRKLPDAQPTLTSVNANLTAARAEYRKALAVQSEMSQPEATLATSTPEGRQAMENANLELSAAAGKYEDALRDFMNYTDPHGRR